MTDGADLIAQKIRKAKTDPDALPSESAGLEGRAEAQTLVGIFAALADGALRAEEIAAPIIDQVNDIVGFLGAGAKSG